MVVPHEVLSRPVRQAGDGAPPPLTAAVAESVDRALDDVSFVPAGAAQECLVADARATLTPADMVERKLMSLLKDHALAISQVQMLTTGRSRGR